MSASISVNPLRSVMDLLDGESLGDRLARERHLVPEETIRIVSAVLMRSKPPTLRGSSTAI